MELYRSAIADLVRRRSKLMKWSAFHTKHQIFSNMRERWQWSCEKGLRTRVWPPSPHLRSHCIIFQTQSWLNCPCRFQTASWSMVDTVTAVEMKGTSGHPAQIWGELWRWNSTIPSPWLTWFQFSYSLSEAFYWFLSWCFTYAPVGAIIIPCIPLVNLRSCIVVCRKTAK